MHPIEAAPPLYECTPEQAEIFRARDFDRNPPGTILRDFQALLDLIGEKGLPATASGLFANKAEEINATIRAEKPRVLETQGKVPKQYQDW